MKINSLSHTALSFAGGSGIAVSSGGSLFNGSVNDQGYPIAIFALVIHLFLNILNLISRKNIIITPKLWELIFILFGLKLLFLAVFLIGGFVHGVHDWENLIIHYLWILAIINGVMCSLNYCEKHFYRGIKFAFIFLVIYNIFDIIIEFRECGLLLCGLGRVSPASGLPGLYQEYIYMPALILGLFATSYAGLRQSSFFLALSLFIVVLTGSREGVLIFLIFCILHAVCVLRFKVKNIIIVIFLTIIPLYFLSANYFSESDLAVFSKLSAIGDDFAGENSRIQIISEHIDIISNYPLIGTGFIHPARLPGLGQVLQPSAHNSYVDIFANGGIFIFISIVFFWIFYYIKIKVILGKNSPIIIYIGVYFLLSMNINTSHRASLLLYIPYVLFGVILSSSFLLGNSIDEKMQTRRN